METVWLSLLKWFYIPFVLHVTALKSKYRLRMLSCEKSSYEKIHESKKGAAWFTKRHIVIEMEGTRTQTRKWEGAGESSRVREVCGEGLTEGGMKERGPDGSEQESKAKYLIGIKCPDSVRGRLNSTKRAAFPLARMKHSS